MGGKGSGGSNRKSIEDHIRAGTYKKSRHGEIKDRPLLSDKVQQKTDSKTTLVKAVKQVCNAGLPAAPDWLDDLGKKEWQQTCHILKSKGTLDAADPSTIEAYCAAYSRWKRAEQALLDGFSYKYYDEKTLKQKMRGKLELTVAKDALNQVKSLQDALGLLIKTSVVIAPPDDARSEMEKFLDQAVHKNA